MTMTAAVPLLPAYSSAPHTVDDFTGRVVCLDAMELLRMLPDASVDMVLADLPYGVTACAWDTVIPIEPMWAELKRVVKQRAAIVLTATQPFTSRLVSSNYEMFKYSWVWVKNRGSNFANAKKQPIRIYEDVLVFGGNNYYPQDLKRVDIQKKNHASVGGETLRGSIQATANKGKLRTPGTIYIQEYENYPDNVLYFDLEISSNHPTQKPVALFEYLIRTYTQENDIVLDMTCGSGTTAIAARKTGRRFICGDNSPEYVALAQTRLQNTDPFQDTVLPTGERQLTLFKDLAS